MGLASLILAASLSGPWSGSYSLGGPSEITFVAQGKRAAVALGVGHADLQVVPAATDRRRIRFRLPGAPRPLLFNGRLAGGRIRGTVRQGSAHGTFQVQRGSSPALVARGVYSGGG